MKTLIRSISLCAGLLFGLVIDGALNQGLLIKDTEARLGRPLTPASVAGVARRTAAYVSVLPAGCTTVIIEGTTLQQCNGAYYQSSGNQYVIVNVD